MKVEDYRQIRKVAEKLHHRIIKSNKNGRRDMLFAAKMLDIAEGDTFYFDDEEETSYLMDYIIYEKNKVGKRLLDIFYDSDEKLSDSEEEILEGMVDSHFSLFEVNSIDKEKHELTFTDILDPEQKTYNLLDIGLSASGTPGILLFSRFIPIQDIYMTSGANFPFPPPAKDLLIKVLNLEKIKKARKLNSADLFALAFRVHRQFGAKLKSKHV